jgi:hypothetical protein
MGRAAQIDVSNLMTIYQNTMNSRSLPELVSSMSAVFGNPAQGSEFSPESLLQKASMMTGETITPEAVDAGSQDLMIKLKATLPQAFSGILGGSLDKVMSDIASEPVDVQNAIRASVMPSYEQALSRLKS